MDDPRPAGFKAQTQRLRLVRATRQQEAEMRALQSDVTAERKKLALQDATWRAGRGERQGRVRDQQLSLRQEHNGETAGTLPPLLLLRALL